MNMLSKNLKKYVINNSDLKLEDEVTEEVVKNLKILNINRYNYRLEEEYFVPKELELFESLEECSFSHFLIKDDIIESMNKLTKLNNLEFDNCEYYGKRHIENILEKVELNCSEFSLFSICKNKENIKRLFINDNKDIVDAEIISKCENLEYLYLLNSEIKNLENLLKLSNVKNIKIQGCKFDDITAIEKLRKTTSVTYSEKRFLPIG